VIQWVIICLPETVRFPFLKARSSWRFRSPTKGAEGVVYGNGDRTTCNLANNPE